jgi:uncharacterized RDD family membrane protein YckC
MKPGDVSVGLVVLGVRAGARVGRLAVLPLRVVARTPLGTPVMRRASLDGADVRARVRTRAEAAADSALEGPEVDRVLDAVFASRVPDEVVKRLVDHVLESGELDRVVEHVAASPVVREAVTRQTTSYADELAVAIRRRCVAADDAAERAARALIRRPPRPTPVRTYGGLATRTLAFLVDLVLVAVVFLVGAALGALVLSVVGDLSRVTDALLLGVGWTLATATYFVFFWSTAGQTPGMRVLRQRVACRRGGTPGVGRSLVRFVVLTFGVVLLLAGALLILVDDRRRGLHDLVAGTVVVAAGGPLVVTDPGAVHAAEPVTAG